MRTFVLIASLALLSLASAAVLTQQASADSAFAKSASASDEEEGYQKVSGPGGFVEEGVKKASDSASSVAGSASSRAFKTVDDFGNVVDVVSNNKAVSSSGSSSSNFASFKNSASV